MFLGCDIQTPSPQKPLFLQMEVGRIQAGTGEQGGLVVSWWLNGLFTSVFLSLFLRADSDKAWCGYKRPPLSHPTSSKHCMVLGIGGSYGRFHMTALRSQAKNAADIKRLPRIAHGTVGATIHGHTRPHKWRSEGPGEYQEIDGMGRTAS